MESGIGHRSDRTVGNMINVGLIGFGVSGKGIHLPLIRQVDDYNLLGVVSRSLSADDAEREGLLVYSTVDDMILNSNIDLIVITSPSNCHYEHARLCLSSGKHVVVEKPFCSSTLEAAALIQIALDEGLMLNVFHNRRYDVDYCSVKRVISSGVLGGISHFSSSYHRYRPNV